MNFTGQDLLDIATLWYLQNGAVQIPEFSKVAGSNIYGGYYYSNDKHTILSKNADGISNAIREIPGLVIPLLAAVGLGFDSVSIAKIIKDHQIPLLEITGMAFDDPESTGIQRSGTDEFITPVRLTIEAMRAFSTEMENWDVLSRSIRDNPHYRESVGIMHTNESMLWPINLISEHALKVMTPVEGKVYGVFNGFTNTASAPQTRDELPSGNPIEFLRRSGMLSEPVLRKQTGLFSMWEDLLFTANNDHRMQQEILHSLRMLQHKPTQDLVVRGLLSFSVDASDDVISGPEVYKSLRGVLGQSEEYAAVFESLILKLNLIPITEYGDVKELEYMASTPDLFDPLLDDKHTLVSRVANELLARPSQHLGHSEYAALRKLSCMSLPAQEITFSPEKLVNHILDSMNTFVSPNNLECWDKRDIDALAGESVTAMAKLLVKHHDFDYQQLDHRSEKSKLHLIKGGLDIRKFSGLGNRVKGLILDDQMGL